MVKNEYKDAKSDVKNSLGVTTVAMTIHATTPKLIPILDKEVRRLLCGDVCVCWPNSGFQTHVNLAPAVTSIPFFIFVTKLFTSHLEP